MSASTNIATDDINRVIAKFSWLNILKREQAVIVLRRVERALLDEVAKREDFNEVSVVELELFCKECKLVLKETQGVVCAATLHFEDMSCDAELELDCIIPKEMRDCSSTEEYLDALASKIQFKRGQMAFDE